MWMKSIPGMVEKWQQSHKYTCKFTLVREEICLRVYKAAISIIQEWCDEYQRSGSGIKNTQGNLWERNKGRANRAIEGQGGI